MYFTEGTLPRKRKKANVEKGGGGGGRVVFCFGFECFFWWVGRCLPVLQGFSGLCAQQQPLSHAQGNIAVWRWDNMQDKHLPYTISLFPQKKVFLKT